MTEWNVHMVPHKIAESQKMRLLTGPGRLVVVIACKAIIDRGREQAKRRTSKS